MTHSDTYRYIDCLVMQGSLLPTVSLYITIYHRIETQIETRVFNMTTRHIKADTRHILSNHYMTARHIFMQRNDS